MFPSFPRKRRLLLPAANSLARHLAEGALVHQTRLIQDARE